MRRRTLNQMRFYMLSQFKKVVVSVAMLGCVLGMQAEENKPLLSSTVKKVLASAGLVAGGVLLTEGLMYKESILLSPALATKIGSVLAINAALYFLYSAKGIKAKIRSLCGSFNLLSAGMPAYMACRM